MQQSLSGAIGDSLAFTITRARDLAVVSLLPFLIMTACIVAYMLQLESRLAALEAEDIDAMMQSTAGDLLLSIVCGVLFMWIVVKVHRLYLAEETPTLIGTGGSIKAAFFLCIYYLGVLFMAYIPLIVGGLLLALVLSFVSGVLFGIGIFALVVLAMWLVMRMVIGFVPISLGEWPGFFSGWALTRNHHVSLFFGFVLLSLIISAIGFTAIAVLVGIGYLFAETLLASLGTTGAAVIAGVLYTFLLVPLYWPMIIYMADVYVRLSGRSRPLPVA